MTRKRFKKLLMARGYSRRGAEVIAWLEWLLRGNYARSWETYLRGVDDAANPACDLNGDLKVNLTDLNIILASYNYLRGAQDFIFE